MQLKLNMYQMQELSVKMQISMAVELTLRRKEKKSMGKEIRGTKSKANMIHTKKNREHRLSSVLNTHKTVEAHSHMAIAHCSRLIVNTATAVTLVGRH